MKEYLDLDWTEVKFENNLDRITSMANPRQNERVPAGAKFKCEFVLNVFDDDECKYLKELLQAMKLLEDDYLGGHGSRGYGQVKFINITIVFRNKEYYTYGNNETTICNNVINLDTALNIVNQQNN